MDPLLNNYI
jgi:hypothetical protein